MKTIAYGESLIKELFQVLKILETAESTITKLASDHQITEEKDIVNNLKRARDLIINGKFKDEGVEVNDIGNLVYKDDKIVKFDIKEASLVYNKF